VVVFATEWRSARQNFVAGYLIDNSDASFALARDEAIPSLLL
jgi:hypothetical protein